jgi:hypothetical protein
MLYFTKSGWRNCGGGIGGGKKSEKRVVGSVGLTEARIVALINRRVVFEAGAFSGETGEGILDLFDGTVLPFTIVNPH